MSVPDNITKEHLLQAISKMDAEGIPKGGDSQYYDAVYNGKTYPPKMLVAYANIFANGSELDRKTFEGGLGTPCFKLLERNGFDIIEKSRNEMGYFEEIKKFLDQADTGELGTSKYLNNYSGFKVSVSFGKGNAARIPWIAFLRPGQTVQKGIYPVYLYYKKEKLLVLAFGISETIKADENWNLAQPLTISFYFSQHGLGTPIRYGSSFVFKVYDITQPLNEIEINEDLNNILEVYKKTEGNKKVEVYKDESIKKPMSTSISVLKSEFNHNSFYGEASKANLFLDENLTLRFIASLLTKPFVILTGLSGSGKTKLAQAFAAWICEDKNQYVIVPVGADWTNREPLLGFPNALKANDYVKPENKVLDLILAANQNKSKPYFLILDEMNLSHVERYFADFLSVMESKSDLCLHAGDETWNGIPGQISFPDNLFIIGTVNIDETTYMFSPKVLDRSNVIEFRVTAKEMEFFFKSSAPVNLKNLEAKGANMSSNFIEIANDNDLVFTSASQINEALLRFFIELKKTGAEFGYRSASEILRFAAIIGKIEPDWALNEIIDAAIMQKLLPKVHGSRRKLEPVLKTLGQLCVEHPAKFSELIATKEEIDFTDSAKIKYPISFEKILRMHDNLVSNGFTSYAEA